MQLNTLCTCNAGQCARDRAQLPRRAQHLGHVPGRPRGPWRRLLRRRCGRWARSSTHPGCSSLLLPLTHTLLMHASIHSSDSCEYLPGPILYPQASLLPIMMGQCHDVQAWRNLPLAMRSSALRPAALARRWSSQRSCWCPSRRASASWTPPRRRRPMSPSTAHLAASQP